MQLKLYTLDGQDIFAGVAGLYIKKIQTATQDMNRQIPSILKSETANHFSQKYPGSQYYDPNKIQNGNTIGNSKIAAGSVVIDIPGINRAYQQTRIYPKRANYLAIPIHKEAYGKNLMKYRDYFI